MSLQVPVLQAKSTLTSWLSQVVTVNDYLARRDSEWVGQVHRFLGLSVGLVQAGLSVSHSSPGRAYKHVLEGLEVLCTTA